MKQTSKNELVKNYILNKINCRFYNEGQMIESESKLCEILNVSRMTIRKALEELTNDGILYKEQGRGTFVARKPRYADFRCGIGFSEDVRKRGMNPSSKDSKLELIEADEYISKKLHIPLNEKVWHVSRIRCANNEPIVYVSEYYLYSICPDLTIDIVNDSIYDYLEKLGITFSFFDQKLEAILCPQEIAEKLGAEKNFPVILMTMTVYMKNGTAYNFGINYVRTDKFKMVQSVYNNGTRNID